jgi:hypothetical protein
MSSELKMLAEFREQILLAEVGAWQYGIGKPCNLHIEAHSVGGTR